jgi:hypothetical protein
VMSAHAIERYHLRCGKGRPGDEVSAELDRRVEGGRWMDSIPGWLKTTPAARGADGYFELAEGVVLSCRQRDGVMVAVTCLRKGTKLDRRGKR